MREAKVIARFSLCPQKCHATFEFVRVEGIMHRRKKRNDDKRLATAVQAASVPLSVLLSFLESLEYHHEANSKDLERRKVPSGRGTFQYRCGSQGYCCK